MQSITLKCIFLFTFSPHMFKHICRNSKPKLKRFNRFVKTPQKSCKKKHGTKNHVLSSQHSPPSTKTTPSYLTGVDLICGISGAVLRLESYFWCIGVTFSELCSILRSTTACTTQPLALFHTITGVTVYAPSQVLCHTTLLQFLPTVSCFSSKQRPLSLHPVSFTSSKKIARKKFDRH